MDSVISGPFKYFTLHNRDHAKKLLHLCEYVIDSATIDALSGLELLVIGYASYLHDLGMSIASPEERSRIIESQDFQDVFADWPELAEALQRSRKRLQEIVVLADARPHSQEESAAIEADRLRVESDLLRVHW